MYGSARAPAGCGIGRPCATRGSAGFARIPPLEFARALRYLSGVKRPGGEIGKRDGLKIRWEQSLESSSLSPGIKATQQSTRTAGEPREVRRPFFVLVKATDALGSPARGDPMEG
jgi:hypothetical protein